jgi:Zn-dependent peptidase ImmA (M78 family)
MIPVNGLDSDLAEIEHAAKQVRALWGIAPGPVPDVVELLEAHGITVIRLPLGSSDVDAFSLPFADHPVVVLSTDKDDRARSRFDGAHELGHLVVHGEQIWGVKEVETQAHRFAAEFLMPAAQIYDQLPTTVDWPTLFELKRHWQVSLAALLMRARTLKRMTEGTYLSAIKTASARGWRRVEPVPLGQPEQPTKLLSFLASPDSTVTRAVLPSQILESIQTASTA